MTLESILSQDMIQRLGWTLLHFVWEATVVAFLLAILLVALRKASSNVRYIMACAAMGLIVLLPIVTMTLVPVSQSQPIDAIESPPPPTPVVVQMQPTPQEIPIAGTIDDEEPAKLKSAKTTPTIPWKQRATEKLEASHPYLVMGWLIGVFGLSLWHLGGWAQLQRLKKRMVKQVDAPFQAKLYTLAEKLRIHRTVRLVESALVQVPTVVGWLRPVILLPASALTGLAPEQLEALLAHELAHIRRYDYFVNILQTIVETLGFYHPGVWWVSHKIRVERENCCDDLAVVICGDRVRYARALASMEEIRSGRNDLAVAASGGNLFGRIRRLIGKDASDKNRAGWIPFVVTFLLIAIIAIPATLALTENNKTLPSAEFILQKMLEHRARVRNLQYTVEDVIWRDAAEEAVLIEGQIKRMREKGMSERQLEKWREQMKRIPETRYQILKCIIDDAEHVKIELTTGTYDSSGKKAPGDERHIWAWNGVAATRFDQRNESPGSAMIRDIPGIATKLAHPWKSFTGIFCGFLQETIEAGRPVSVEKSQDVNYRVAFDYKTRRYVAIVDPSKGYTCALQETYNKQGQLNSRSTATYKEIVKGIWFPVSGQREEYTPGNSVRRKSTLRSTHIRINDPAFNPGYFDVEIPKGTSVRDFTRNAVEPEIYRYGEPKNIPIEDDQESGIDVKAGTSKFTADEPRAVKIDLSVVEVSSDSKIDRETTVEIRNLLGDQITIPDSSSTLDLLKQAAKATSTIKSDSAHDKNITQQQFNTLVDVLASRDYLKILMKPTMKVAEGKTAKISSAQHIRGIEEMLEDSIQIKPHVPDDDSIVLQVEATLHQVSSGQSDEQTPTIHTCESSSQISFHPGESRIIGDMKKTGLQTQSNKAEKDLEKPDTEILIILTPTIVETAKQPPSLVGKELPGFQDFEIAARSEDLKNRKILLCFWDMNQRPSRNMIIELAKRSNKIQAKEIFPMLVQTSLVEPAKLNEWLDNREIRFSYHGGTEAMSTQELSRWGVRAQPWLILADEEGIVQAEGLSLDQLDEKLQEKTSNASSELQDEADMKVQNAVGKEYETVQLGYSDAKKMAERIENALRQMPEFELGKNVILQPLEHARQITIFGRKDAREFVKKLIAPLDTPNSRLEIKVFQLKYIDPDPTKEKIEGSYEQRANEPQETVRVISLPAMKQVTVIASAENMPKITKQIAEWDVFEIFKPRIVKLQHSDPVQMARLLTSLFAEEGWEGVNVRDVILGENAEEKYNITRSLSDHFTFEEVPDTHKIIVISNIPQAYDAVVQWILELDQQKIATKNVREIREWMAGQGGGARLRTPKNIDEAEQSSHRMKLLGLALALYAEDHDGTLPGTLMDIKSYLQDEADFQWMLDNAQFLGKGQKRRQQNTAHIPIAYDKTALDENTETNVLFLDFSVRLLDRKKLNGLGLHLQAQKRAPSSSTSKFDRQVEESAEKLKHIGKALRLYANDHEGKYPERMNLRELQKYMKDEEFARPQQPGYLGGGRTITDRPDLVIYHDINLIKFGKGTNVLFNDGHVEFADPERLNELNINETSILIDIKILTASDAFMKHINLYPNSSAYMEGWSDYRIHTSGDSTSFIIDPLHTDLLLKAATAQKDSKVIIEPRVNATDGGLVTIQVLDTHAYSLIPPDIEPNNPSGKNGSKSESIKLGTLIRLEPDALPDGKTVNLDFEWEHRRLMGFKKRIGPDPKKQKIPQIAVDKIATSCPIPEGKTLLIVGKRFTELKKQRKVQLGDLPLIGGLFHNPTQTVDTRNLLILIKPVINSPRKPQGPPKFEKAPPLDPNDPLIKKLEKNLGSDE